MSSDEEDFMSDKFLVASDTGPGLAASHSHRRQLQIERNRIFAEETQKSRFKPKHVVEKERREEALAKPVGEESKGFQMLAKMGFKAGMSLGKKKDENDLGSCIKEPIGIDLKSDRTGLGHATHEEERSKVRLEMTMQRMKERARMADELADDYRKRRRGRNEVKIMISDILKCMKTCAELDQRKGIEFPVETWFWPCYKEKPKESEDGLVATVSAVVEPEAEGEVVEEDEVKYVYANGKPAPMRTNLDELDEAELQNMLSRITWYLRSSNFYCVWCGCLYGDEAELNRECPGDSRQLHDDGGGHSD